MDALPVELQLHIASLVGARPRTMNMVLADDGYTHPYNQEFTVRSVMGGEVRDGTIRASMTLPPPLSDEEEERVWTQHFEFHMRTRDSKLLVADPENEFVIVVDVHDGVFYHHGVLSMVARRFAQECTRTNVRLRPWVQLSESNENASGIKVLVR